MLENITTKRAVADEVTVCKSRWCQARGLMFTCKNEKSALIFEFGGERQVSLHMFFVFYAIDVIFMDKNKRVVDLKNNFRPFTAYSSGKKAKFVAEVAAGLAGKSRTKIGDRMSF
ncbi:MAG: hypothetical protein QS98_C0004G0076 [archaeon GW2011_AR3]|nr:MAG: hypothetical protein QS98_C0004G0076 [archaeon GW2011_AR3]MBS3109628.1 DUF192 domain-containing protein [Candidatus Woesearchaeota archaeon]